MLTFRKRLDALAAESARALEETIARGPPPGSRITQENWIEWNRYECFVCPDSGQFCENRACGIGADCRKLAELGFAGDRTPLPRKRRPACGAKNRRGEPCTVRVEPGKRRCRFHGGLSTGPRTPEGRERIAEAMRLRWARRKAMAPRDTKPTDTGSIQPVPSSARTRPPSEELDYPSKQQSTRSGGIYRRNPSGLVV
jgi:hypothetical protein